MKSYDVTIRATVTKTIKVQAESEDKASELAHQEFTLECEGDEEDYEQETLDVSLSS